MAKDLTIAKSKNTLRSATYVEFVRSHLPCCICGKRPPGDPHHTTPRGQAAGSDALVVPVCRAHHPKSERTFEILLREHHLDLDEIIRRTQLRFCQEWGYDLNNYKGTFEDLLIEADLATREDDSHRVSRGTKKSHRKERPWKLTKTCNTPSSFQ